MSLQSCYQCLNKQLVTNLRRRCVMLFFLSFACFFVSFGVKGYNLTTFVHGSYQIPVSLQIKRLPWQRDDDVKLHAADIEYRNRERQNDKIHEKQNRLVQSDNVEVQHGEDNIVIQIEPYNSTLSPSRDIYFQRPDRAITRHTELMKVKEEFESWKRKHLDILGNRTVELKVAAPSHVNNSYIWNQMLTTFPLVFRRLMKPFLADYRNPCFHQHDGALRCLPYFILVGAAKSGSTDLYYHITRHPQVVRVYKEPHFWTHMEKSDKTITKYLYSVRKFSETMETEHDKSRIFGDGSPSYFWENSQLPRDANGNLIFLWADVMHAVMPGAKIIMILRNPINRTISDYFYSGKNQSPQDFHRQVQAATTRFQKCRTIRSYRECATRKYYPRLQVSVYIAHVREWLRVYPRDQVLILRTEDWHNHSNNNIFQRIFKFLEIDELSEADLPDIGEAHFLAEIESKKATEKKSKRLGLVLQETRAILDDFFEPYNKELAKLLNDDAFLWKD